MRYAILHHTGIEGPHFDLLFETSAVEKLATWRSDAWPIDGPTVMMRLADHRRAYLDYEGPISGNRGHVTRIESGLCSIFQENAGRWRIELSSGISLVLEQLDGDGWRATASAPPRSSS